MTPEEALQLTDLWALKQALQIPFVLDAYGHEPALAYDGKLHYHSPFRDDDNPSFDLFKQTIANRPEPEQRWGDFAEGTNGDVFDLIQRLQPELSPVAVHDRARELLAEQIASEWNGPTVREHTRAVLSMETIQFLHENGRPLATSGMWLDLALERPALAAGDFSPVGDVLFAHPNPDYDAVVYIMRDETGRPVGAKIRDPERRYAVSGSKNVLMRLDFSEDPELPVLLCEGETDTWAAWSVLRDQYEVLGVPGVGNLPEKVAGEYLNGRTVIVAFDPDPAGVDGRHRWMAFLESQGCDVHALVLPEGRDLASLSVDEIRALPERVRTLPPSPSDFDRSGPQWVRVRKKDVEPISNWSFEPRSVLRGEDGSRSFEGRLLPHNRSVVLPASALTTTSALQRWGMPFGAAWWGDSRDVAKLMAWLLHEGAFLPEGEVTTVAGLHNGTFVIPDDYVGSSPVHYTEPAASVGLSQGDKLSLPDRPVSQIEVFETLYAAQDPGVTGPFLAWLAAAPLRTRFREFPLLSVTGVSGSGKTALTETFLRVFSGSNITTNLTSSTPHGVSSYLACSNGFPVWFDEYRPGARADAKQVLDQSARDAYTGQASARGGQNRSNLNEVTLQRMDSPIVVTGEDDFIETSHTDRMVLLRLRAAEQGPLHAITEVQWQGFARAYLRSLQHATVRIEEPPVRRRFRPTPVPGLRPRPGMNMAVLQQGWELLEDFLRMEDPGYVMPELDLSRVIEAAETAGEAEPVMEAIRYLRDNEAELHGPRSVWSDDEGVMHVHVSSLLQRYNRSEIPGAVFPTTTTQGIRLLLQEKYGAKDSRAYRPTGARVRTLSVVVPSDDAETEEP